MRAMLAALVLATGCTVPNTDHCLHQQPNGHAWCIDHDRTRTFCSPCEDDHNGCVASPPTPTQCPEYEPPDPATESGAEESGGTAANADTGTGETGTGGDSTTAAAPAGGAARR